MFHALDLSVEDKVLRSSMFLSSGWAWKSRGQGQSPARSFSMDGDCALLLHKLATPGLQGHAGGGRSSKPA